MNVILICCHLTNNVVEYVNEIFLLISLLNWTFTWITEHGLLKPRIVGTMFLACDAGNSLQETHLFFGTESTDHTWGKLHLVIRIGIMTLITWVTFTTARESIKQKDRKGNVLGITTFILTAMTVRWYIYIYGT